MPRRRRSRYAFYRRLRLLRETQHRGKVRRSILLTLVVIPCLYSLFDDGVRFFARLLHLDQRHRELVGAWRRIYVISAVIALYLNVFVLIAQLFDKVPALKAIAPTQTEAPFKVAQLATLLLFIVLGVFGAKGFRNEPLHAA